MHQKLHQHNGIIAANFAVAVAVGIFLSGIVQHNRTSTGFVQQDCIGDVHSSVEVEVAVEGGGFGLGGRCGGLVGSCSGLFCCGSFGLFCSSGSGLLCRGGCALFCRSCGSLLCYGSFSLLCSGCGLFWCGSRCLFGGSRGSLFCSSGSFCSCVCGCRGNNTVQGHKGNLFFCRISFRI